MQIKTGIKILDKITEAGFQPGELSDIPILGSYLPSPRVIDMGDHIMVLGQKCCITMPKAPAQISVEELRAGVVNFEYEVPMELLYPWENE